MTAFLTDNYRPLSTLAVISGVLGVLSLSACIAPSLVAIAAVTSIVTGITVIRLWSRSADVAGLRLAIAGGAVSTICLFGASLWHSHRYVIEVPAGHERVNLSDLFDMQINDAARSQQLLHEHRIAVKVYAEPTGEIAPSVFPIRNVAASGSSPEPSNCIMVRLKSGTTWEYSASPIIVAGVFRTITNPADGKQWLVLDDAAVHVATSPIGLPEPRKGC